VVTLPRKKVVTLRGISSLLLKRYQKRLKSKELEKQDILKNKEALQENFNVLNKEINQKKQDLISYSLQLIHNKELFQSVIQDLKNINQLEKSEQDKKISSIISTIKIALSNQKDWDNFRNYFDSIHQNFFTQLNKKYPNLTSTDHKIAALTILGLDNKQAASILDVEPETVKVSKNRLKKKLSLVAEDDLKRKLNEFVIELN
jgi:DNA-binding CsgD family transcriptional regulator